MDKSSSFGNNIYGDSVILLGFASITIITLILKYESLRLLRISCMLLRVRDVRAMVRKGRKMVLSCNKC